METPRERLRHAIRLREQLARHYADLPLPNHISNGDDDRYATQNYFASFTKGLPHVGPLGEVDRRFGVKQHRIAMRLLPPLERDGQLKSKLVVADKIIVDNKDLFAPAQFI